MNIKLLFRDLLELIKNNSLVVRYREHNDKEWRETVTRDKIYLIEQIGILDNHIFEIQDFLDEDPYNLETLVKYGGSYNNCYKNHKYIEQIRNKSDSVRDLIFLSGVRYRNTCLETFEEYMEAKRNFDEIIEILYEKLEARL